MIIDQTPISDRFAKKYKKKFSVEENYTELIRGRGDKVPHKLI